MTLVWQGAREDCLPVQLLQLLQQHLYPESDAAALVVQASASVFIYSRTIARLRSLTHPTLFSRMAALVLRWVLEKRASFTRFTLLLLLLLLFAAVGLFKLRRGGILRALQLLRIIKC